MSGVINQMITLEITYHNVLHGFREGEKMGATYFESKLLLRLTTMKEEGLYKVFLKLRKSCDALNR